MTKRPTFKPGDDLSYYLGPDAVCATEAQCEELQRALRDAERAVAELVGDHKSCLSGFHPQKLGVDDAG